MDKREEYKQELTQLREEWKNSIGNSRKVLEIRANCIKWAIKLIEKKENWRKLSDKEAVDVAGELFK